MFDGPPLPHAGRSGAYLVTRGRGPECTAGPAPRRSPKCQTIAPKLSLLISKATYEAEKLDSDCVKERYFEHLWVSVKIFVHISGSTEPGSERVQTSKYKLAFHHQVSTEMTCLKSSGNNLSTYRSFIFPNIYFIPDQRGSEGLASLHWRKNRINTSKCIFRKC